MRAVNSTWKRLLKAAIVGEVVVVVGSYRVWHQMNTDRDYRKWMNDNHPAILEIFYKTAELGGYMGAREADAEAWASSKFLGQHPPAFDSQTAVDIQPLVSQMKGDSEG